jgi:hypothetical protein
MHPHPHPHPLIHLSIHPLTHPPTHLYPSIHTHPHPHTLIHPRIHTPTHSPSHLPTHLLTHLSIYTFVNLSTYPRSVSAWHNRSTRNFILPASKSSFLDKLSEQKLAFRKWRSRANNRASAAIVTLSHRFLNLYLFLLLLEYIHSQYNTET